ncbi:AMP-binding protein [Sphaerotilus microaerophilus]|uniref:2-aminobenzoate-CoA ligase n=1 Tax=Sphaerotilus microaerophilus TaxID=2914710 RepID=A0ABN6PVF0_9BURK|nr:AMP-binding protein [Sphaerotilus sp. FB-5]BDI07245.1 2-aminobenzoate-CoA ligase [Sphaerotilus sp. FB-5]
MIRSAHQDTFAREHLPAPEAQPQFLFDRPELQFPERLNCASELLDRHIAEGRGDRVVIRAPGGLVWTYAELQDRANRIAEVLVGEMGLVPGNRVLLRAPNNPMLAACWFGVIKAGGIAVGTMPLLRAKELKAIIEKGQVTHALCDVQLAEELAMARPEVPVLRQLRHFSGDGSDLSPDGLEAAMARQSGHFTHVDTAADDCCLFAFTSGTTGIPKATMHFHRDVMAVCAGFPRHILRPRADDVFIGSPPLAFTFGLGGLLLFPMTVGASTVLLEKAGPPQLLDGIQAFGATTLFTAPTTYRTLAARGTELRRTPLRQCVSAGEVLPAATRAQWKDATGIELIDGIGATELLHIFISADEAHSRPGATGRAVPGYRARVVDDDGREVPPGTVGKLAVQGPTGCRYLDDARQAGYVRDGWNLTGDAYLMDADGYFFYQARTDDMIVSAGYNIASPEVEDALMTHPAVAECAVIGVPDEQRGQIVKAFVVLRPGQVGDDAMARLLQDHVKQAIAPYKYPRAVAFRSDLPRTQTGKLQRFKLKDSQ